MKNLYNKNDEKEMKALMGFKPVQNGKMELLLAPTLPTELSIMTTNSFQNHACHLNMSYLKSFDFICIHTSKCKHSH